jgi:hypothetical protein
LELVAAALQEKRTPYFPQKLYPAFIKLKNVSNQPLTLEFKRIILTSESCDTLAKFFQTQDR